MSESSELLAEEPDDPGDSDSPTPSGAHLTDGELTVHGRIREASNLAVLAQVGATLVVYKPVRGEAPLWDFPDGTLAGREVAAYRICAALGWDLIPPTVLRDGPLGVGMVQEFVPHRPGGPGSTPLTGTEDDVDEDDVDVDSDDHTEGDERVATDDAESDLADAPDWVDIFGPGETPDGYRLITEALLDDPTHPDGYREIVLAHADTPRLRLLAALDVIINNADRKGSHILTPNFDPYRPIGIDHGISLHVEPKLRTVLWGFAGEPLPAEVVAALDSDWRERLAELGDLAELITSDEIAALELRIEALRATPVFPGPGAPWGSGSRPLPWPPV